MSNNKRDTIEMAREASIDWTDFEINGGFNALKTFEALVRADERKQIALDKKADNARELGLDYEPVWCGHCNGSGRMVRDPDIGTDQECFVCDGAGVPAAPVQEPVGPEPFGYFQYDIRLDAWVQNRINNKGVAFYTKEKL